MKKFTMLLLLCVLFTMAACNHSEVDSTSPSHQSIQDRQHSHSECDYPCKDIKIEKFISAIISEGTLIPGENIVWNMDKETFTKEIYGAELLDSESDLFQEHRNATMPDGNSSVQPPLHVIFEDIDKVSATYPIYLFDSENKLYCVNYRYVFEISQKDQYKNIANKILDMLTQEKNTLILQRENEITDMNTFDVTKDKLSLKWFTVDQNQFFKMMSVEFQERLILDLIISNKSTLSQ